MKNFKRIFALALAVLMVCSCIPATVFAEEAEVQAGVPALPTATVTNIQKDDLTFAMNFKADEVTAEQMAYYGNWYADFELTVNKTVTFDANGGADGYLAGQYDGSWVDENSSWNGEWVYVPFEPVTLEANKPLRIMAFAAEMLGEKGLKYTYREVAEVVKNFNCGAYFTPEFLKANPDLVVTLELKAYNNADESENYVIGETYTFCLPELPTATVTDIEKDDLTFAMNFKADEVTAKQMAYFGNWYADFELTVNKKVTFDANGGADGYLAGQYDGSWVDENSSWNGEWVYVPFEPVTLEANETLRIMAFAAEMMGEPGLKYTYKEVAEVVKNFSCGAFFTPEFLLANPDLEVTLELKMYNPANEAENYVIGETYKFYNSFVAYNVQTNKYYTKLADALAEATEGQTVRLIKNTTEMMAPVLDGVTLDLNGYELTASYVFVTGDVVDDSASNSGKLIAGHLMLQKTNRQLPVKDASGAVKFYEVVKVQDAIAKQTETSITYAFQTKFETAAHEALLAGMNTTGVKILVRATWTRSDGTTGLQEFVYNDNWVETFINSYSNGKYGKMFTLELNNYKNYENFQYQVYVVSEYAPEFTIA